MANNQMLQDMSTPDAYAFRFTTGPIARSFQITGTILTLS